MSLLISPHDDDSVLYAAFTCLREQPLVVIVTDSYIQPARGWVGCDAETRAAESVAAHAILECPVQRLGLRDDALTDDQLVEAFRSLDVGDGLVYVPALEGGNPHHDLVALVAGHIFGADRLRCYSTYAKLSQYDAPDLQPVGTTEIEWTRPEYERKQQAMACYASQIRMNGPHFQAVLGRSEWLSGPLRLQLGCGEQVKAGWLNVDRRRPETTNGACFQQIDLTDPWADLVGHDRFDYLFSEDLLEHLPPESRAGFLNQCWDVLVEGGVMEHYVPNAGSQNDYGSLSHLSHWNLQTFEHVDVESRHWQKDRAFEGIRCGFRKVSADLLNWKVEDDGMKRAQSLRVRYRKVAC